MIGLVILVLCVILPGIILIHLHTKTKNESARRTDCERNMKVLEKPHQQLLAFRAFSKHERSKLDNAIDDETSLDAVRCKQEIKELIEPQIKFCESACEEFELLTDGIKSGEAASMVSRMAVFVQRGLEAENRLTELEAKVKSVREKYRVTPGAKLARSLIKPENLLKDDCLEPTAEMPDGLLFYKLPVDLAFEDKSKKIRRFQLGFSEAAQTKPKKVIMMVGMTGAGKSLMINNLINYIYGVQYKDNFRFKLIVDDEEINERETGDSSKSSSMTSWVTGFDLDWMPGFGASYNFTLIDTPGFADNKGMNYDELIIDRIRKFFNSPEACPAQEIASIGFVIQSACSRLTDEQRYIFDQVLNLFGKDMTKNVTMLFTFADAQTPPALECVKSHQIPYSDFFKFNNSALYAPNPTDDNSELAWKFGYRSVEKLFLHLQSVTSTSLTLTKSVLDERDKLKFLLEGLREKIDEGMDQLKSIESMIDTISSLKGTMKANGNYKITKQVKRQRTEYVNYYITNCTSCMYTCHSPCSIAGDLKSGCAAITDEYCDECPGECHYTLHSNGSQIYKYIPETVHETVNDMLRAFNIASSDKNAKKKLLEGLLQQYQVYKQTVYNNIQGAAAATNRLDEIAMRNTYLTNIDYIKRLIDSEERGSREHKENRLKQLRNMLKMAVILDSAKNNPQTLTKPISDYEQTVIKRIEGLEEEDDEARREKMSWKQHFSWH